MMKAVLDTNVIISGVIKGNSIPGQILKAFTDEDKFLSVTSLAILEEVGLVIRYEKIRKLHGWSEEKIMAFLTKLYRSSLLTHGKISVKLIKEDTEDDKFISCAIEGKADYIVSGDIHLKKLGEFLGIKIISPRSFKEKLKANP